jgi:hypothetical protein
MPVWAEILKNALAAGMGAFIISSCSVCGNFTIYIFSHFNADAGFMAIVAMLTLFASYLPTIPLAVATGIVVSALGHWLFPRIRSEGFALSTGILVGLLGPVLALLFFSLFMPVPGQ